MKIQIKDIYEGVTTTKTLKPLQTETVAVDWQELMERQREQWEIVNKEWDRQIFKLNAGIERSNAVLEDIINTVKNG